MYPECFDGIGELKVFEYHIELDHDFKPRVQTSHKVPLSVEPIQRKLGQKGKLRCCIAPYI